MKKINPAMRFMIITNDVREAQKLIPGVAAYNFDLARDYAIIKNAEYLLLANSSFTYFPAFTSTTVKKIIAPKYWARHNVSDGYWASEQNIYEGWTYQDRQGRLFSAEECREELARYKKDSPVYAGRNQPIADGDKERAYRKAQRYYRRYRLRRYWHAAKRKIRRVFSK